MEADFLPGDFVFFCYNLSVPIFCPTLAASKKAPRHAFLELLGATKKGGGMRIVNKVAGTCCFTFKIHLFLKKLSSAI